MQTPSLCTGQTAAGNTNWQVNDSTSLYLDVNTAACGFTTTPRYQTSLGGNGDHWYTVGGNALYEPTATGFRLYVRYSDGRALTPAAANNLGWQVQWSAITERYDLVTQSYSFNGQRIAQRKDGVLTYLHADQVGSTLLATDVSGAVVGNNQPRYFAYGREPTPSLAALPTDYTYTGQKQDGSGLVYMNARYYDPVIGQFISPDSLVPDPTYLFSYNRFMYVNGNPLRYNDPSGHGDPTAGALPQPNSWQTALDAIKLAATSGVTVIAASEVGPPAMAAAATVTVVGGGYVAVQWAMQDMGPDVPPLYPTLGHNVGDGNISITIPVPSSTTMTSGVPLTPGAQTQSTGATAVNQPAQQIVEPLPAQQKGSNIVVARKYSSSRKHEVGGWGTLMGLSDSKAQEVLNNGVEDPNSKQVYGYYQGQLYEFQPDNVGGYHGYPIPGNQAPPAVLRMMRDAGTISNAVYNKLIQGKR